MIKRKLEEYKDIIDFDWPRETLRPKMPLKDRAKIFLPFSALKGYEDSLENVRHIVDIDSSYAEKV